MNAKYCRIHILILLVALAFIWGNSLLPVPKSDAESKSVLELIRPFLEFFVGKGNATDHLVRKIAHFVEFAVLGSQILLLVWAKKMPAHDKTQPTARLVAQVLAHAVNYGFIAAFIDESIQMFSGRGNQIIDVWLDVAGVAFGAAVSLTFVCLYRKRKSIYVNQATKLQE